MADNSITLSIGDGSGRTEWVTNQQSANASGGVALKAAPGAGANLYLEAIHILSSATAGGLQTVVVNDDTTALLGPYEMSSGAPVELDFPNPIKVTANKALNLVADSGEICVTMWGFTV